MKEKYYCGLDFVKLFCAILVVCIHTEPFLSVSPALNSLTVNYLCRVAVPFFFISSGFLAFRKNGRGVCGYIKKLLKLYLIWSVVYFPLTMRVMKWAYGAGGMDAALRVLLNWAKNMIFSAGYGVLWYLPATIVAVGIVWLLQKWGLRLRGVICVGALLYCVGLLGQSYFGLITPLRAYPALWNALRAVYHLIGTTRNGVFEGVIFIALGARLAQSGRRIPMRRALFGFAVSMLALLGEIALVTWLEWKLAYDMYLMLVPSVLFLMLAALNVPDFNVRLCKTLRPYIALIYFSHMLFVELWRLTPLREANSLLFFGATLAGTVAFDTLIIRLSRTRRFAFLNNLF